MNTTNNNVQTNNNLTDDNNLNKKDTWNSTFLIYNKSKKTKITFLEGDHDFNLYLKFQR